MRFKILKILSILFLLQLGRIFTKSLIFSFVERSLFSDTLVSILYMLVLTVFAIILFRKKKIEINMFPSNFNKSYIVCSLLFISFFIFTLFITKSLNFYGVLSLFYNAIITVVFEEIIFRGYVYKEISSLTNEWIAYLGSTILFGFWHIGYIDTVIWRTSLFFQEANILEIMFWKVITGMLLGVIIGFFRYKNKNVYSSILVHSLINTFGG